MNIYQQDFRQTPEIFRLIKAGDNAAAKDHLGRHPEEVRLLGWMNATPLHIAVSADNLEMVQFLVQSGADVQASRSGTWPFPLDWAKSRAVAAYLLDHGASLETQALEYATRSDVPEVIDLLLSRGATFGAQSPPYLFCKSIAAIQVYLDHGAKLDGHDDHGRTLLHHLVWSKMAEAFDFAYAHGAPWRQDLLRQDPYYFGRSGGRVEMMAHIKQRYPDLAARTVRVVRATEFHFKHASFLLPCAVGGNALVVWTRGERLGRIEIHEGRWAVTKAVHVNVCDVWGFCIDENGDIVLPTGDDVLLILDAVTLQLKRTLPVPAGVDVESIHSLQSRQMYLAHGDRHLHLLNPGFELIKSFALSAQPTEVRVNAAATLVATRHFNYELAREIYHLDPDLTLNQIVDLEDMGHGEVKSVRPHDHGLIVTFERLVVAYRHGEDGLVESWQLPLERYPCERDRSCAVLLGPDRLIVGRGRQLLRIDAQTPEVTGVATLDLANEIGDLYLDTRGEHLIVHAKGLKLLRLEAIHWDPPG